MVSREPAIRVSGLTKSFRTRKTGRTAGILKRLFRPEYDETLAVDELEFEVGTGERIAFVGPNGAGKSTTIKMLVGILHPTRGEASVLGYTPWEERLGLAYQIGCVFGQRSQLWPALPARQALALVARIYDLDQPTYEERLRELSRVFDIEPFLAKPIRQLSLGQRMRCEIVASLLHRPRVLFLDEPTIGLDVVAKARIRDLIRTTSDRLGTTVLLTSHDTGDIERVCDRVLVINHGGIVVDEPVPQLRSHYIRRKRVTLLTADPEIVLDLPNLEITEREPYRLRFEFDAEEHDIESVLAAALKVGRIRDITLEDPPLEEIIEEIYARGAENAP